MHTTMEMFRSPPPAALFSTNASAFVAAALQQQQSSPTSNLPVIPSPTDHLGAQPMQTSTSPVTTSSASPPCLPLFLQFPSTSTTTSILMDTVLAAQKLNQQHHPQLGFMVAKQEPQMVGSNNGSRNSPPNSIKVG
uniref:Uncharacterized protein n=1 Tax=Caenorhabditis japonica TaxID=281687 RepID=A0A8R1HJG0_CAEJA